MFYKFNPFTQSINPSSQNAAMGRPQSAKALTNSLTETKKMYYDFQEVASPRENTVSTRQASQAVAESGPGQYKVPNDVRYQKLMEMQSKFVASDGKLVWQKLPMDRPIYLLTVGLVIVASGLTAYTLQKLAAPPKND